MKTLNTIVKILAALAAVAGAVYVVATYGEQITAWAAVRNVLTSFFSGSGRRPQSCGLIKRFSAFY